MYKKLPQAKATSTEMHSDRSTVHCPLPAAKVQHHLQYTRHIALMGLTQIRCFCLLFFRAHGELTKPAQLPDWACGLLCKINYEHLKSNPVLYAALSPLQFPFLNTLGWINSLPLFASARPGCFKYHLLSGSALQWIKKVTCRMLLIVGPHCHRLEAPL